MLFFRHFLFNFFAVFSTLCPAVINLYYGRHCLEPSKKMTCRKLGERERVELTPFTFVTASIVKDSSVFFDFDPAPRLPVGYSLQSHFCKTNFDPFVYYFIWSFLGCIVTDRTYLFVLLMKFSSAITLSWSESS